MRWQYYAVKWGDEIRVTDPVPAPRDACISCYGMVSRARDERPESLAAAMHVVVIGTRKVDVRRAIRTGLDKLKFLPMLNSRKPDKEEK